MTIAPATRAVHRAELDSLDAVTALLEAEQRRDVDAYRACLDADLVERVDGLLVALGADAGAAVAQERWTRLGSRRVEIDDVSVVFPVVYVRSSVHEPHAEGTEPRIAAIGYSIYETHGRAVRAASHYVRRFDADAPEPVPSDAQPSPVARSAAARPHRAWKATLAGLATILVQDLFLAAPVIAATANWGGARAFLALAPIYTAVALLTAGLTLRLLRRHSDRTTSRLAAFLDREINSGIARWTMRAGGTLGFVVGAYLFSAAPTVWAMHGLGLRRHLRAAAVLASLIWGMGFVAFYAGAATLIGL